MTAKKQVEALLQQHPDGLVLSQLYAKLPDVGQASVRTALARSPNVYIDRYDTHGMAVYCFGRDEDCPAPPSIRQRIRDMLREANGPLSTTVIAERLNRDTNFVGASMRQMPDVRLAGVVRVTRRYVQTWRLA